MNIVVFATELFQLGGAESLQVNLAVELSKRSDVSVRLLHQGRDSDSRFDEPVARLRDEGLEVDALGLGFHPGLRRMYGYRKKLRDYFKRHNTHIVETAQTTPSILAAWATRGTSTITATGIHEPMTKEAFPGMGAKLRKLLLRSAVRKRAKFYAVSSHAADCWASFARVPRDDIKIIYNSISTDCFQASSERDALTEELDLSPDRTWLLFVGRIRKDKGVLTLLEAAGQLTDLPIELLFVGGMELGHEPVLEAIKQADQTGPLAGHVRYLGHRNDVPTLMASSDLFVLPTEREGFGMVLIEAMAAGCDVIATNVDALPEVLDGSGTSMVPPDDPSALAEAIRGQLALPPQQRTEHLLGLARHAQKFTLQERVETMLEWFESLRHCDAT
jgi:glycosyltransferase involved in cell wall biosynthesis